MTKVNMDTINELIVGVETVRTPRVTIDRNLARDIFHEMKMHRAGVAPVDMKKLVMVQELTMDWARAIFADAILDMTDIADDETLKLISQRFLGDAIYKPSIEVLAA